MTIKELFVDMFSLLNSQIYNDVIIIVEIGLRLIPQLGQGQMT